MRDHRERSSTSLAHGAVKSGDIERVRHDVHEAEVRAAHDDQAPAAGRRRRLRSVEAERKLEAQP